MYNAYNINVMLKHRFIWNDTIEFLSFQIDFLKYWLICEIILCR